MTRATVRVTLDCNSRCVFCAQDGVRDANGPSIDERIAAARATSDELTFVGGEPTLDPDLVAHVAAARSLGFRRVGLQTNGSRLAEEGYATSLAAAGLTDVHLSIHGVDAAAHDYHTAIEGSFVKALAGLAAARANGLVVVATTLLTRSTFRVLAPIPRFLASRGVAAWTIAVPRTAGRALAASDRVIPRLALAIPFALHAVGVAGVLGMPAWIEGAPLCLLGPLISRALPSEERAYGEVCTECAARTVCCGVDAEYLARFGGDELSARAISEKGDTPIKAGHKTALGSIGDYADLRAMFVGVGELAPAPPRAPTARSRVALPMLGKVKPAHAEVAAGTEKKTGDALREILPELFDEKKEKPEEPD